MGSFSRSNKGKTHGAQLPLLQFRDDRLCDCGIARGIQPYQDVRKQHRQTRLLHLNCIYAGAPNRVLDFCEVWPKLDIPLWERLSISFLPLYALVRKTDRFKGVCTQRGMVDYDAQLARSLPPHRRRRFRLQLRRRRSLRIRQFLARNGHRGRCC